MTYVADLFCGGGGETSGIVQAARDAGIRMDLAAVNHWPVAIETHKLNFPQARAYCQDLSALNPLDVFEARQKIGLLWASPECTHHSVARGGRPRSEQGRASAWLILKWLSELYVRRVILENVPEFLSWGPLGADGKPLRSHRGETFQAFVTALQSLGYKVEWRLMCAADYGTPTTRVRLFIQAVRGGGRIVWPEPTHAREPYGNFRPWIPARQIIDFSLRGESIFNRRKPLAPATLRRIEAGLRRYWGEWAEPFLVVLRGTSVSREIGKPLPTVTAGGGHIGLVQPYLVEYRGNHEGRHDGEGRIRGLEQPLGTQDCSNRFGLVNVEETGKQIPLPFLVPHYGERQGQEPRTHSAEDPVPTIPASGGGKFGLVEPFLLQLTHGGRTLDAGKPLPVITTANRGEIGAVEGFIMSAGGPECAARPLSQPAGTILTRDHRGVVQPFLVKYNGTADARPVRIPLDTISTRDRFGLVEGQAVGLDITFRMLQPHELAAAQGFPVDHRFAGNKGDQVRQIGNAVCPPLARSLALEALT